MYYGFYELKVELIIIILLFYTEYIFKDLSPPGLNKFS